MRHKIEDERDARACLKAAKAAGLAPGAWAREHGIDGRSLNAWRMNLSRGRAARRSRVAPPRLIELVPTASARVEGRYAVRVADAVIELDDHFRDDTLVRLLRALRAC